MSAHLLQPADSAHTLAAEAYRAQALTFLTNAQERLAALIAIMQAEPDNEPLWRWWDDDLSAHINSARLGVMWYREVKACEGGA